jgi:biopolymer transport protein ExbD
MKVELPRGSTSDDIDKDIIITINAQGDVYLEDTKLDLGTLRNRLLSMVKNEPDISVIVNGDKNVRYDFVMQVMDVLKQSGVRHPGLGIELGR